jgi:hypothetical protein
MGRNCLCVLVCALLSIVLAAGGGCNRKSASTKKGGAGPSADAGRAGSGDTQGTDETGGPQLSSGEVAGAGSSRELSMNPTVLFDTSVPLSQVQLYGVKLGDVQAAIPAGEVAGPADPSGWIGLKGRDNVYRVENAKVAAMRVADEGVLAKLGVQSESDVTSKFGHPGQQIDAGPDAPDVSYVFRDGQLTVQWNRKANRITAVTLGS